MFEFYLFIKGGAPTVSYRVSSLLRPEAIDYEGIYSSSYTLSGLLHIVRTAKHKTYKATAGQTKSGQKAVI